MNRSTDVRTQRWLPPHWCCRRLSATPTLLSWVDMHRKSALGLAFWTLWSADSRQIITLFTSYLWGTILLPSLFIPFVCTHLNICSNPTDKSTLYIPDLSTFNLVQLSVKTSWGSGMRDTSPLVLTCPVLVAVDIYIQILDRERPRC